MHTPFAYLVAAVDSDVRRDDAIGAENLRHLGVLFLQVALKLFVPHWQCGEQVLNADRGTALKQKRKDNSVSVSARVRIELPVKFTGLFL